MHPQRRCDPPVTYPWACCFATHQSIIKDLVIELASNCFRVGSRLLQGPTWISSAQDPNLIDIRNVVADLELGCINSYHYWHGCDDAKSNDEPTSAFGVEFTVSISSTIEATLLPVAGHSRFILSGLISASRSWMQSEINILARSAFLVGQILRRGNALNQPYQVLKLQMKATKSAHRLSLAGFLESTIWPK